MSASMLPSSTPTQRVSETAAPKCRGPNTKFTPGVGDEAHRGQPAKRRTSVPPCDDDESPLEVAVPALRRKSPVPPRMAYVSLSVVLRLRPCRSTSPWPGKDNTAVQMFSAVVTWMQLKASVPTFFPPWNRLSVIWKLSPGESCLEPTFE